MKSKIWGWTDLSSRQEDTVAHNGNPSASHTPVYFSLSLRPLVLRRRAGFETSPSLATGSKLHCESLVLVLLPSARIVVLPHVLQLPLPFHFPDLSLLTSSPTLTFPDADSSISLAASPLVLVGLICGECPAFCPSLIFMGYVCVINSWAYAAGGPEIPLIWT
jgi:hypothetical protein